MTWIANHRRWLMIGPGVLIAYLALAYLALPALWSHYEHEPGLASLPIVTRTGSDIPGDPLNVGLIGSKEDILAAIACISPNQCDRAVFNCDTNTRAKISSIISGGI